MDGTWPRVARLLLRERRASLAALKNIMAWHKVGSSDQSKMVLAPETIVNRKRKCVFLRILESVSKCDTSILSGFWSASIN